MNQRNRDFPWTCSVLQGTFLENTPDRATIAPFQIFSKSSLVLRFKASRYTLDTVGIVKWTTKSIELHYVSWNEYAFIFCGNRWSTVFALLRQELNAENATCGPGQHGVCIHQLTGSASMHADILKPVPDLDLVIKFDMHYYTSDELFRSGTYYRFQRKTRF
jgi:hypothetical protein